MTESDTGALLARAHAAGVIEPGTSPAAPEPARPWPIIVLTACGAWLAAVPLVVFVALLLKDALEHGGALVLGAAAIGAAVWVLRRQRLGLFVEQLAVPVLLVGLSLLGWGVYDLFDLDGSAIPFAVTALVALACAVLIEQSWLRTVLAALAAGLLGFGLAVDDDYAVTIAGRSQRIWIAWHLVLLPGAIAALLPPQRARLQVALDALSDGWLALTAAALAFISGRSFLFGAGLGPDTRTMDWSQAGFEGVTPVAGSVVLALAALA
ncbi:MAG: DUF4401 domain-containing protein [Rhodanobacteraceae bacterium]|nr:DUF4401 domain-containing protein [Rhodanobacteraceae bacterium]